MSLLKKNRSSEKSLEQIEKPRKKVKNKSLKPKGFLARKAGVITFWTLFGFMFLVVIANIFGGSKDANADREEKVEKNKSTSQEAVQFSKDFARAYFTWETSTEGKAEREEILARYLSKGLDTQAGLSFENMTWNSRFIAVSVKNTEEKGDHVANITLKVKHELYRLDQNGKPGEPKEYTKYLVVPVAYDGHTFGVYELPKFTYMNEQTTVDKVIYEKRNRADNKSMAEVKKFLNTFFLSYAQDSQEQLNYLLSKDHIIQGLNNTMAFGKINSAEVFEGRKANEFIIYAEVAFAEPETGMLFNTNYQLTVEKDQGKFRVKAMDNEKSTSVQRSKIPLQEEKAATDSQKVDSSDMKNEENNKVKENSTQEK